MTLSEELKQEMLRSIALRGGIDEIQSNPVIVQIGNQNNLRSIINTSSGRPRIHSSVRPKFRLILQTPSLLQALSSFEIRCCLCKKVISYPCWYYDIKYSVNHFHYFICLDEKNLSAVNTHCMKR